MEMTPEEIQQAERVSDYLKQRKADKEAADRRRTALVGPHGPEIRELEAKAAALHATMQSAMADASDERRTMTRREQEAFDQACVEREGVLEKVAALTRKPA